MKGSLLHEAFVSTIDIRPQYPLLSAEKFAVPYSPERLVSIFRQFGILASYEVISIRDATAYCLVANRTCQLGLSVEITSNQVKQIVEKEWQVILEDAIKKYVQRQTTDDYRGYRDLIQTLTTIASIHAWQQGVWQ